MTELKFDGGVNPLFKKTEFQKRLEELYDEHRNFTKVAEKLSEEFNQEIDRKQVSRVHKKLFKEKYIDEGDNFMDKSFSRMKNQLEDSFQMLEDITRDYQIVRKKIQESNLDEYSKALKMLSQINNVLRIIQETRKQYEFIYNLQKEINNYQQNNTVNFIQIKQQYNKFLNNLEDEEELKALFESTKNKKLKKLIKYIGVE